MPLRRPVVSKVGLFTEWPLILIDLYTNEGVVGHSYLEPYLKNSSRYMIPAIEDLVTAQVGKRLAPLDSFQASRRSLNLVGYEGITMIAVAGVDMAIWDALAKAAGHAACGHAGRVTRQRTGLQQQRALVVRCFDIGQGSKRIGGRRRVQGAKLRLGRDRLADDLAALRAVREGAGDEIKLMVDCQRKVYRSAMRWRAAGALDDAGLYWFEEPSSSDDNLSGYAQLARELQTPVQIGENFYGPRAMYDALAAGAVTM